MHAGSWSRGRRRAAEELGICRGLAGERLAGPESARAGPGQELGGSGHAAKPRQWAAGAWHPVPACRLCLSAAGLGLVARGPSAPTSLGPGTSACSPTTQVPGSPGASLSPGKGRQFGGHAWGSPRRHEEKATGAPGWDPPPGGSSHPGTSGSDAGDGWPLGPHARLLAALVLPSPLGLQPHVRPHSLALLPPPPPCSRPLSGLLPGAGCRPPALPLLLALLHPTLEDPEGLSGPQHHPPKTLP